MSTNDAPRFKGEEYHTRKGLWHYRVGTKGISLVKVYELERGGPLHVEYWTPGPDGFRERNRHTLASLTGRKVYDKDLAMEIADHMSDRQWENAHATSARAILGRRPERTLEQLLDELHRTRAPGWSRKHRLDQDRLRTLWLEALGPDRALDAIDDALVQRVGREIADAHDWSPRRHGRLLSYMREAMTFAADHLKWVEPRQKLTALTLPKVKRKTRKVYTPAEVRALMEHAPDVDLRLAAAIHIAVQAGRRLNAILQTRADAVVITTNTGGQHEAHITFPAETDKRDDEGLSIIRGPGVDAIGALMDTPAAQATGLLFPSYGLDTREADRPPISAGRMRAYLRTAEKNAGVPYVKYRGFHAFKKFLATHADPEDAADQSGTGEPTLRGHYRHATLARKRRAADQVLGALEAAG